MLRGVGQRLLLMGFVGVATMAATRTARAVTFSPIKPAVCPTTTNIAWNYRIGGKSGVFDLPSDPNCSGTPTNPRPHYINNINNNSFFVSNAWVGYVGFRVNFFSTESNYDFVRWG